MSDLHPAEAPERSAPTRPPSALYALTTCVFTYLFVTHAWMVDDAYITLRTVDHFVNGRGLVWNVGERVQAYTHPLWMFLMSIPYAVTRESFYTIILLSFAVCLATLASVRHAFTRAAMPDWSAALVVTLLVSSKAIMDWSSSGLENPLTNLFLALFYGEFLFMSEMRDAPRNTRLFVLAGLSFVNRQDTLLLMLPACAYLLYAHRRDWRRTLRRPVLLGALPAVAWVMFAVVYYGSPYPNTLFAKFRGVGLTSKEVFGAGFLYSYKTLTADPITFIVMALAVVLAVREGTRRERVAAAGIVVYYLYVTFVGAATTHMMGRYFSGPMMLAALVCASRLRAPREAGALVGLAVILAVVTPASTLKVGTPAYQLGGPGDWDVLDLRQMTFNEGGASLSSFHIPRRLPHHSWYEAGRAFRLSPERVHVGGLANGRAMGYCGFAAGPDKHIIDVLGLTDPLVARLPREPGRDWNPGHVERVLPEGYVESVRLGQNRIVDPSLHEFYDAVRLISRGPLWSAARWSAIWRLNTGGYNALVRDYMRRRAVASPAR